MRSAKGMTPITKNIRVVDEHGNEYEATYLKRAKGLAKNGRARFIDENTLLLACPPYKMEDNEMEKLNSATKADINAVKTEINEAKANAGISPEWIQASINKIINDKSHIDEAVETVKTSEDPASIIDSLRHIVREREETNRQTLKLLEKMYDNLTPNRALEKLPFPVQMMKVLKMDKMLEKMEPMDAAQFFNQMNGGK